MAKQTVFLGADHAGFHLKEELKPILLKMGLTVVDLSPVFVDGDDYPTVSFELAVMVTGLKSSRGVLVCGSGVGVVMAANRIEGARAFDAYDERTVKLAREDNDANIIALSGWHQASKDAAKLLKLFFATPFSKAARHHRRVKLLG
jgi:ribose 5-phosphate isomerase B